MFLPIISFLIIYIVPPLVITYITWFIYTYWIYVIEALWGWFLMMYNYSTKLIECKLGEKWYIRMVTGWNSCNPAFADYFNQWKTQYVDIPIYYEKLKYVEEYNQAKEKYWTIPKFNYITIPSEKTKINMEYANKTFIQRTMDNLLAKISIFYHNFYTEPRDRMYEIVLKNEQKKYSLYNTISKYIGKDYKGRTTKGRPCNCKGSNKDNETKEEKKEKILKQLKEGKEGKEVKEGKEEKEGKKGKKEKLINDHTPTCIQKTIDLNRNSSILILFITLFIGIICLIYRKWLIINIFNIISKILTIFSIL